MRFMASGFAIGLTAVIGLCGCAVGPQGGVIGVYPVAAVGMSPDGNLIAAGTTIQGVAYLLDAQTLRIKAVLTTPTAVVDIQPTRGLPVTFSPDGKWVATAGMEDGVAAHIWDAETGKEIRRMARRRSGSRSRGTASCSSAGAPTGRCASGLARTSRRSAASRASPVT